MDSFVKNFVNRLWHDAFGILPPERYDRATVNRDRVAYWQKHPNAGPRFEVTEHAYSRETGEWDIWTSTYRYVFEDSGPWQAESVLRGFYLELAKRAKEGVFKGNRMRVSFRLLAGVGPNARQYPEGGKFDRIDEKALAYAHAEKGVVNIRPTDPPKTWDLRRLEAALTKEDNYDADEQMEWEYGNHMSRVEFLVHEYRQPDGGSIAAVFNAPPKSVIELPIFNDTQCGQACLAFAMASSEQRKNMTRPERKTLRNQTEKLALKIGVAGRMALGDFDSFVRTHPQYTVVIMEGKEKVAYSAVGAVPMTQHIYLLLYQEHYYYINNIRNFARPSPRSGYLWCNGCTRLLAPAVYRHHACEGTCPHCQHYFASEEDRISHFAKPLAGEVCAVCNAHIAFEGCKGYHRCQSWRCLRCLGVYPLSRRKDDAEGNPLHTCGEKLCNHCDVYYGRNETHRCYINSVGKGKHLSEIWAYDIEATLDPRPPGDPASVHTIALVVAKKLYANEVEVFAGEKEFLDWVETRPMTTTLIAHNGSGYDAFLVHAAILARGTGAPEEIVLSGQKVMYMRYRKCRFIDSMRHVAGSLSALAKTFGLTETKGFFPYTFFTQERQKYVGPVPDKEFFKVSRMSEERAAKFHEWHAARRESAEKGNLYSIWEEAVKYCRLDVELLAGAMERYRTAGIEATGVDPFGSPTIAGYALKVYRSCWMPKKTIPLLKRIEHEFVMRGFFGGRTDARQMLVSLTPAMIAAGWRVAYEDVVSLYPAVLSKDLLPCGAPWWVEPKINGADSCASWLRTLELNAHVAMVECEVECPSALYHPVLLTRREDRLVASLDITSGVWASNELVVALEKGYKITSITKALVSETSRDLFKEYIDTFMEMKARHSPGGAEPNDGRRAVAKMMLNSLWGKLAQRDRNTSVRYFTGHRKLLEWRRVASAYNSGRLEGLDVIEATPEYLFARLETTEKEDLKLKTTDLLLAAFVTSRARMRLYERLDVLGERVMYHDTDSVIARLEPDFPDLERGTELGEWSDELTRAGDPQNTITDFVALGPKTYAYRTARPDPKGKMEVVKSKGFSTGFTFDEYRDLAEQFLKGESMTPLEQKSEQFRRKGREMESRTTTKKLVASMQKVAVVTATRTLPWGHEDLCA